MLGEFDSRKDLQSAKFEQRPQILVKPSFRELCNSKLSGLHAFGHNSLSVNWKKKRKVGCEFMRHQSSVIFVTLTENSSVITNDTQGPQKYLHHRK